jgi:hypothetical protein
MTSQAPAVRLIEADDRWTRPGTQIQVGKDVLELLSSSMYTEPLSIYREYIQNSVDAIDELRNIDEFSSVRPKIDVTVDSQSRRIKIRDNGPGVPANELESRLLSIGGSKKRGRRARGFRGVGRLAGLGYCQELYFRTRSPGEEFVNEIRWDCRRLKSALRAVDDATSLQKLVAEIVAIRMLPAEGYPSHFFEVDLQGVVRHGHDQLLNEETISKFISEVAPAPFDESFVFCDLLREFLSRHVDVSGVPIHVNGSDSYLCRPLGPSDKESVQIREVATYEIPSVDDGIAALAWIGHHEYAGALSKHSSQRGLRLRSGNIQVGDNNLLEDLYVESRFNSWTVGEVHVIDRRIVPNGRRDNFESSVHFDNLKNHLAPIARDISRRCRESSISRNSSKRFALLSRDVEVSLKTLKQPMTRKDRRKATSKVQSDLTTMERVTNSPYFDTSSKKQCQAVVKKLRSKADAIFRAKPLENSVALLPKGKRQIYEQIFELIVECSPNRLAGKKLVERILTKVS